MKRVHDGPIISSGILLGAGLGGFVDGIVLHQILQWHNLLSSVHPPVDLVSMKLNMLWDGIFHALTWTLTVVGIARLWAAGKRDDVPWSTKTFVGSLFLGWGSFNAIEGTIDHQIFGIHHVHPGEAQLAWDLAFIASGLVMVALGWLAIHSARGEQRAEARFARG